VVSIYKCPTNFWGFPRNLWRKNVTFWPIFRDFHIRHRISPERDVATTNKNANVHLYCCYIIYCMLPLEVNKVVHNVSPKRWPTFRDFYPFRHCDSPFGGHYVATIIVATCLVNAVFFWFCYYRKSLGTQDPMDLMCWCVFHSHREIYWLYRNWKLRFSLGKLHLETEDIRIFTVGAVLESQYVYIRLIVSVLIHSISYTTFIHWKHFTERTLYF